MSKVLAKLKALVFLGNLETKFKLFSKAKFTPKYFNRIRIQDLNRHWHDANPWKHPTIHAIKKLLQSLDTADEEGSHQDGDRPKLCLEKGRYLYDVRRVSRFLNPFRPLPQ